MPIRFRPLMLALAVAMTLAWVAGADARTVEIAPKEPIAKIDLPDSWKVRRKDRGIEAKSGDDEVWLWFETIEAADREKEFKAYEAWFRDQGITIKPTPPVVRDLSTPSVKITAYEFDALWKGEPTVLRYMLFDFDLPSKKLVLMSYWASPDGDRNHDGAMSLVMSQLRQRKP